MFFYKYKRILTGMYNVRPIGVFSPLPPPPLTEEALRQNIVHTIVFYSLVLVNIVCPELENSESGEKISNV